MSEQRMQYFIFGAGERDCLLTERDAFIGIIDLEFRLSFSVIRQSWRGDSDTLQDCLNSCGNFTRTERLNYIVVCPNFQTDDSVYFIGSGSQENYRNI